jgi:hypothetical protein
VLPTTFFVASSLANTFLSFALIQKKLQWLLNTAKYASRPCWL